MTELNPQTENLFLLGGISAKIDGVMIEQSLARSEASAFREEVRGDVIKIRHDVSEMDGRVGIMESKQGPRTPWYAVIGGIGGIAAVALSVITLLNIVNP